MTRKPKPVPPAEDRFLSITEVCDRYGLSRDTVSRLVEGGNFPPMLRITDRLRRFRLSDLRQWESERTQAAGDQTARDRAIRSMVHRGGN